MKRLKSQKENRRSLRKNQTNAEALMWRELRNRQLCGWKFRRQHGIGPFILDFYCHDARLGVEIDGGQHALVTGYDTKRTAFLLERGIKVIRYWNHEVLQNLESVLEDLLSQLEKSSPSP